MMLPKILNEVETAYINATPDGNYALRILRYYRSKCNEMWEVHGLSPEDTTIYKLINQYQLQRAEELDKAIQILEEAVREEAR